MSADELDPAIASLAGPVLVVGASGFVGANLLRRLLAVRPDVFGTMLHGSSWRLEGVPASQLLFLDLLDPGNIRAVLERVRPRTVFHCAAYGAYSFQADAERIYRTNFLALADFLEAAGALELSAFVHAGSSSEYGLNAAAPAEDAARLPNSPYAVSKSAAAELIAYHGRVRGLPCVNLRLYSLYGPYEDSSRLIPALVERGLHGALPPLVGPETGRDFVHVDDALAAFVAAAGRMGPALAGRSLNVASGRRLSIREVAEIARAAFGIAAPAAFGTMEGRAWDLAQWYGDARAAQEALGWRAAVRFEDGLARTAAWWKEFLRDHRFEELTDKLRPAQQKNSISAVVACYKDAQAIPLMHRRLSETFRKLAIDYEIIFVNDCSPDDSREVIRALSAEDPRVLGISHSRNFGSQAAFRSGMELSTRAACVLLDGDLQDPPELIEQFVARWREGYDVVYGRRVKREMPFVRGLYYKAFYRVFDALSYIPIPKDAGDFSLMDRRVVQWILRCRERDSFLRGLRAFVGFRQTGVDYDRPERAFGVSTNNLFKNLGWAKQGIFAFSKAPLVFLTVVGSGLTILTFVLMAVVATLKVLSPGLAPKGISTLLLAILFFGSLNLLGFAILGEYIGKIIDEVKLRPGFIRTEILSGGRARDPERLRTSGQAPEAEHG
jgi:dolichol-phosphate mannosyltransferase